MRSATYRPGRSLLCIALIASATFVIIASLDAFRQSRRLRGHGRLPADGRVALAADPRSQYPRRPRCAEHPAARGVDFVPFRLRPGDDASCLNLYQPRNPRILAPPAALSAQRPISFSGFGGRTRPIPGCCSNRDPAGGAIPAIADANSMTYALHLKLGEEFAAGRDAVPHRRGLAGQRFSGRTADLGEEFSAPVSRCRRLSVLPAERPTRASAAGDRNAGRSAVRLRIRRPTHRGAPGRASTGWRTRTFRRSAASARWDWCWAPWDWRHPAAQRAGAAAGTGAAARRRIPPVST